MYLVFNCVEKELSLAAKLESMLLSAGLTKNKQDKKKNQYFYYYNLDSTKTKKETKQRARDYIN
mgnify:CR=1 FL=1